MIAVVDYYEPWYAQILKSVVIFLVALALIPVVLMLERKLIGRFQSRYGPNRVGPYGLLQPLADILKLAGKQVFRPQAAVPVLFALGPALVIFSGITTIAILPFGDVKDGVGFYGIDVSIGILYFFAVGSIAFYGLLLGGWASGSRYSFLGAMRAAAQLISYEVSQGLALVGVVITAQSLSLVDIVHAQGEMWYIVPQFVGFLGFLVAGAAEINRPPFDLPEADAELVQGYMTEYGGTKMVAFLFGEYLNMLTLSLLATTFFLGGWLLPFGLDPPTWVDPFVVLAKMFGFLFFFMWIRATLPRLRYDQLMSFGWKVLLPLATLAVLATAIVLVVT